MEAETSLLIEALKSSNDLVCRDLAQRLWRCQQARLERRRGIPSRGLWRCRSPACAFCRTGLVRKKQAGASEKIGHAANADCYLVTVLLARSEVLEVMRNVVSNLRRALRNLRNRRARQDPRWGSVEMIGRIEIDAVLAQDLPELPPRRRQAVEALPIAARAVYPDLSVVWIPHAHIAVHAPGLAITDLQNAFQRQWPGAGRVGVRRFLPGEAGDNAGRVIAYACKHEMCTTLKDGFEFKWPMALEAMYWGWLHRLKRGLQPLKFKLGRTAASKSWERQACYSGVYLPPDLTSSVSRITDSGTGAG